MPLKRIFHRSHLVWIQLTSWLSKHSVLKIEPCLLIAYTDKIRRGAVVARSLPWLRSLFLQHASSILSQESSLAAANSLYQLIESRVSTFDHTLQLSSCLDLLYAESVGDGSEENDIVALVIHEDEDENDGGSEDSMEVDTIEDGITLAVVRLVPCRAA